MMRNNNTATFSAMSESRDNYTSAFLTSILSIVLSVLIIYKGLLKSRSRILLEKFPGPRGNPIFGNTGLFMCHPTEIPTRLRQCFNKYGRYFHLWLIRPHLVVADYEIAKKILSSPNHLEKAYEDMKHYFGDGLITASESKWRKDRKDLEKGFRHNWFPMFLETFNRNCEPLMESLRNDFIYEGKTQMVNLLPVIGQCTLRVVCEAVLGESTEGEISKPYMFEMLEEIVKGIHTRVHKPWLTLPGIWQLSGQDRLFARARNDLISFIKEKIVDRKYEDDLDSKRKSIMNILIDSKNNVEDILDHVVTMLAGGTDTSANAVNYTLFLLALNPQHQQLVHEEIERVSNGSSASNVTFAQLSEMKYLEMCIKEALRLYPPVPFFARTVKHDIQINSKQTIPEGCIVSIWLYELHRNPDVFPDPETFDPTRFTPEACATRPTHSYLPFSSGIRNCIGQKYGMTEVKVILFHILQIFQVMTETSREDLKLIYGIVLEPYGGIPMSLKPRDIPKLNFYSNLI